MNIFNNFKVGQKIILSYFTVVCLMAIIITVIFFQINNLTNRFTLLVEHYQPILANAHQLQKLLVDMETGERGFLITGKEEFLEPYYEAINQFDTLLETEKQLVSDNPTQVAILEKIGKLHDEWNQKAAQPEIAKRGEANKATVTAKSLQEILKKGVGKGLLDQLRGVLAQMETNLTTKGDLESVILTIKIAKNMVDQETGQRGFIITGEENFLEPYQQGQAKLKNNISALRARLTDDVENLTLLNQVALLSKQWLERAGKLEIQARQEMNANPITMSDISVLIQAGTGKNILDAIRSQFDHFIEKEVELNLARSRQAQQNVQWAHGLTIGLTLVGIMLIIILGVMTSRSITHPLSHITQMANQIAVGNLKQMMEGNRVEIEKIAQRRDEMGEIGRSYDALASYFQTVIEDIVQVSQNLAQGNLNIKFQSEYRGDFVQIKNALEIAISNQRQVIGDIVQVSQKIAEGESVIFQADYHGDFAKIQKALEMAALKLTDIMSKNAQQDWLKTGQNELNEQMSGVQNIVELTHNIVSFLTLYLEAQVGICYLINDTSHIRQNHYLEIVASYAQTRRKNLTEEFQFSEGLVERAAKELKTVLIKIEAGLEEELMLRYLFMMPFLYENKIKGVIVLGALEMLTQIQQDFLHQVMPSVGIAVNSVESRAQMQQLLQQTQMQAEELQNQQAQLQQSNEELKSQSEELQSQSEELQSQAEELQSQAEELRQTNEALETRTQELERQKSEIYDKNLALEKNQQILEAKAQELELASRYKSEFLANMSHELRTPLNSLLILSQLLVDNKSANLTEKQIEYAQTIHSAGVDLLNLINDILDLSKVEAGKIEIHLEEILLADFIEALKLKFSPIAENKGLAFHLKVADGLPAVVNTDGQRLNQIINNLLANAFKFTHQGEVKLTIQRATEQFLLTSEYPPTDSPLLQSGSKDNFIIISISDTGIGIPKDKQQVIFEAFQQADGTTSRRYGGTGLGLSIARQFARLLGGDLSLHSEEGKGSTFTLYLPESHSLPIKTSISLAPTFSSTGAQISDNRPLVENLSDQKCELEPTDKSILIIEDDRNFSKILMEIAKEKQFKCLLAEDGRTGLQLALEYKPSAILLDIGLPQMDGWMVMEQLKSNPETRHIPVYFLSAADQNLAAKNMGALGYLVKPVNLAQLKAVFGEIEQFLTQTIKKLLVVVDNQTHQQNIQELVVGENIQMIVEITIDAAFSQLQGMTFDCIILDLDVQRGTGFRLLEKMQSENNFSQIPVVVYAERDLTAEEEALLRQCAQRIPIKLVQSVAHLLDETTLFLHQAAAELSEEKRNLLNMVHDKTAIFKNKRVLIVDDDVRNTFALATLLEDKDMEVVSAQNGEEALDKLKTHQDIDIVLMDIMMPKMDGYEAMRQIRKQPRYQKLPIIALTAKAMKGDKAKCIEAGANDYLSKPIDSEKLISLMRVWLCH
jgi:signal transduction histidine kinase/CheY-like chemotaxis protein/CHASE3 domain sensor protein